MYQSFGLEKSRQNLSNLNLKLTNMISVYLYTKIYVLLYVDNCILFCKCDNAFNKIIKTIQELFNLTEQNIGTNMFEYLGIELTFEDSKMTLRQNVLCKINTLDQIANIFTKGVEKRFYVSLRDELME